MDRVPSQLTVCPMKTIMSDIGMHRLTTSVSFQQYATDTMRPPTAVPTCESSGGMLEPMPSSMMLISLKQDRKQYTCSTIVLNYFVKI